MSGNDVVVMVVVLLSLAVTVTALVWAMLRSRSLLKPRQRVVVNLVDDTSIEGVLWARSARQLVVRDAVVHEGTAAAHADGEIVVDVDRVRFVQVAG